MTMMRKEKSANDREVELANAIDDLHQSYMVSYRLWDRFDSSYGLHYHLFYEILIHKCNGSRILIGPDEYDMVPHSFYVIAPHQLHTLLLENELVDYERICIYINEARLLQAGLNTAPILDIISGTALRQQVAYTLTEEEYNHVEALAKGVHRRTEEDVLSAFDEAEDLSALTMILSTLCRAILRQQTLEDGGERIHPWILRVVSYLSAHCLEPISLDDVAREFNVSKYYLSHAFSEAMGTSIYQYLLVGRIAHAKKFLMAGDAITNTAYRCGFNDYSSFLRCFAKIVGKSPSEFRRQVTRGQSAGKSGKQREG